MRGGGEEQVGSVVGEDPVHLLGHAPVEGAQARLHMGHRDVQLRRGERARQRGVGVPVDEDPVWPLGDQDLLDAGQHRPGHRAVEPAVDAQVEARPGDVQLLEEHLRHVGVEMLPGVDDGLVHRTEPREGPGYGGRLDELRAGAHDGGDLDHARANRRISSATRSWTAAWIRGQNGRESTSRVAASASGKRPKRPAYTGSSCRALG